MVRILNGNLVETGILTFNQREHQKYRDMVKFYEQGNLLVNHTSIEVHGENVYLIEYLKGGKENERNN